MRLKLAALRATVLLRHGALLAHYTSTLPGAVAMADAHGVAAMRRFKGRRGPFLLLVDSTHTALSLARFISPTLRCLARQSWPGSTTLIFPAKPGLPAGCVQRGRVAVRVDGMLQCRQLAATCGGLLISSSLNRKGACTFAPGRRAVLRHHRVLAGRVAGVGGSGRASTILRIRGNGSTVIR